MILRDFLNTYSQHPQIGAWADWIKSDRQNLQVSGLNGSALSLCIAALYKNSNALPFLLVAEDADEAAYLYNDIKNCLSEQEVYFFPSSYKKSLKLSKLDASNEILRTGDPQQISQSYNTRHHSDTSRSFISKVISVHGMKTRMLKLVKGESVSIDFYLKCCLSTAFNRLILCMNPDSFLSEAA